MGSVPVELAAELQQTLGLGRAVETGTYMGDGARRLARIFPQVVTIELSELYYAKAHSALRDEPRVTPLHGDSRSLLPELVDRESGTLYFLDGHWSGGPTAGSESECPVLDELAALRGGSDNDCLIIDDAHLFAAPPPPPHDPSQWPRLIDVLDHVRAVWPQHHVTLLADQVIAVPPAGMPPVDRYGQALAEEKMRSGSRRSLRQLAGSTLAASRRRF